MAVGLGQLRLAPRDFWAMTISEMRAAQRGMAGRIGKAGRRGMTRARLHELMQRFPDVKRGGNGKR